MTDKITGVCQECGKQFEYVLKPGFPRKYCFECSEIKKASYAQKEQPKEEFPVVKVGVPVEKKAREFHLTPEQVNTNALDLALSFAKLKEMDGLTIEGLISYGHQFKKFIKND